jgi:hypothetical protein
MKSVLIALTHHSRNTFGLFPDMLARANLAVTIIAHSKFKPYIGRGAAHWIDGSAHPEQLIEKIAALFTTNLNAYDWVILGDDDLLRALYHSPISTELKTRIGPVGNADALDILDGKCTTSDALSKCGIRVAPHSTCHSANDVQNAITHIGYPVVIKKNHSLGSEGTTICMTENDSATWLSEYQDGVYIVEKFIVGVHTRLDPLFMKGQLITASASNVLTSVRGQLGVANTREVIAAAPYLGLLHTLGHAFMLNGFVSMGGIMEKSSGDFYVFELDCRPNPWPCLEFIFGVPVSTAINHFQTGDFQNGAPATAFPLLSKPGKHIARAFVREIPSMVSKLDFVGLLGWLTNRDACWKCLPLHDPRLLLFWIGLVIHACMMAAGRKLIKSLGIRR